jgi:hypothetical protein
MTRTARHDVDYFPFYVKDGKTLFILESKYGLQGIGFFTNLMRFLCKQPDHHICIEDESDSLYFFAQIRCQESVGMDMLNLMAKTGKIDAELWESRRVIVSEDLLASLKEAYAKRVNPIIEIEQIRLSYPGKAITDPDMPANDPDMPQTKLKKTKLKKTKLNNTSLPVFSDEFETFWKTYPRKKNKDKAWAAWKKRNGTRPSIDVIVKAVETQKKCSQWIRDGGQYIPYPATWINGGQWMDEEEDAHPLARKVSDKTIQTVEMLKDWRPPT